MNIRAKWFFVGAVTHSIWAGFDSHYGAEIGFKLGVYMRHLFGG